VTGEREGTRDKGVGTEEEQTADSQQPTTDNKIPLSSPFIKGGKRGIFHHASPCGTKIHSRTYSRNPVP
jgi:hypothetical protein